MLNQLNAATWTGTFSGFLSPLIPVVLLEIRIEGGTY
jgi:hypothetical protein